MRHIGRCSLRLLALAVMAGPCLAEDAAPGKFYRLDFVVKEVEAGRILNARSYSITVAEQGGCSIRAGSRVPTPVGGPGLGSATQYSYSDVGVNIDSHHVTGVQSGLSLGVNADVSSVLQESTPSPGVPPTVRQNKWQATVLVPFKKPTMIFSSDDVTGKRQMQLELTATPIT
jgi:hypothetical protein